MQAGPSIQGQAQITSQGTTTEARVVPLNQTKDEEDTHQGIPSRRQPEEGTRGEGAIVTIPPVNHLIKKTIETPLCNKKA